MAGKPDTKAKSAPIKLVKTETDAPQQKREQPANLIKKKEIYDHVTVTTGLRRREVREAVDATFAYLFECISEGKDVQCPPLGKIKVITRGDGEDAKVHYRLIPRKPGSGKKDSSEPKEALDAGENSD